MKVLVGLDGSIDSAVTAYVLKSMGHKVIGATMKLWNNDAEYAEYVKQKGCFNQFQQQNIDEAKRVAKILGIEHYVFDCSSEFKYYVLDHMKKEYAKGIMPNPCVICNSVVKFGVLPQIARVRGLKFDKFATGYYARVSAGNNGRYLLMRGLEKKHDESYYLYRLSQQQLQQMILPLGLYTRDEVVTIAQKLGLTIGEKSKLQNFYNGDMSDVLQQTNKVGKFVTQNGDVLGEHEGIWKYHIGQKKGLGIETERNLYVLDIKPQTNEVVVGYEEEAIYSGLLANNLHWVAIDNLDEETDIYVKVRSVQEPVKAMAKPMHDGMLKVDFKVPQKAVTVGQSVVLYYRDMIIGGGIITKAFRQM